MKSERSAVTALRGAGFTRTLQRLAVLALCELVVLQPALAAPLTQVPLFTVTSVAPNVMLAFDDSASMQLLRLTPSDYYSAPTMSRYYPTSPVTSRQPILKLNTVGYFGISGMRHYTGSAADDGRWSFGINEALQRSAAFNPLAYNPAVEYRAWNNNGVRMPKASYGGNGGAASGALTEWDMRTLPAAMGGGPVAAKLTVPNTGNLPSGSTLRTWSSPSNGSVRYQGLAHGPATPVAATAPAGADLFDHTINWSNPTCTSTAGTYGWTCSSGSAYAAPTDVCGAGNVGGASIDGTCCTSTTSTPSTRADSRTKEFGLNQFPPPGPAPSTPANIAGTAGEVCTSVSYVSSRMVDDPATCVAQAPYVAPCPGGGGELCTITPPPVCSQAPRHTWRCNFTEAYNITTCNTTIPRTCSTTGSTCVGYGALDATTPAKYESGYWPPARYVVYDGPQPGTQAERNDLSNYRMIMISRKFGWNGSSRDLIGTNLSDSVSKWFVVDAVSGMPAYRQDCDAPPNGTGNAGQDGTWCTFEQEAQNYANWYTYYRSRLFAAVGTVSEVLSGFTGPEQYMRLGFARINYFKGALNPWNVNSITDIPDPLALPPLDGAANEGAVVRGVRPFTVFDPPLSASPNPARQQIFNQLFSINGLGPTPNRETMHAVGQYFKRTDSKGPWGNDPGAGSEPQADHLWCRRNYTVLATDGEWTKLDPINGFVPQRLIERASDWNVDPVTAGVSTSMSSSGTPINGTARITNAPLTFTYDPALEPQITGGSGTQTGTLTDVLHYYWSHDLRTDLRNSLDPGPNNRAFWQHLSTYVVGYGVQASMETPTVRPQFNARNTIAWPTVGLESCRQLDDNVQDTALDSTRPTPCVHSIAPSGNRINDTLRAALSGHGDFFSAQSPTTLRASLDAVFSAIQAENASGTTPSFSSPAVSAGGVIVQAGFRTNVWDGYVRAYDSKAFMDHLAGLGPLPPSVWTVALPPPAARTIATSTAQGNAVDFKWCNLNAAQQNALDPIAAATPCPAPSASIVDYLRGDQTMERRFGLGNFRDRRDTVLGDIVNSSPLYSKAGDYGYRFQAAAAHSASLPHGYTSYPGYVDTKKLTRAATLMFGANDGMFHVLDARLGQPTSGQEIFAYVPRSVYPRLRAYANPAYSHQYTVDGPIVEGDIWDPLNGGWKTIVVGSTGAGPAGLFALDVTSPQSGLTRSNVLWDIMPSDHASPLVQQHLGSVMGMGIIGSVKLDADASPATLPNGKWVFITGNGYESAGNQAALLIFDVKTGALVKAIPTGVGSAASPNGLGAVTPLYDGARNIIGIYAGDRLGNLWKFDLNSDDPANWKIANEFPIGTPKPLFSAGSTRPIHQEPRIAPHPLGGLYVAFGTGRLHEVGDATDLSDQGIFVVWDKGQTTPVAFGDLELLRMDEYTSGTDTYRRLRATDLANYDWNDKGFWIRLQTFGGPANGERIIAPMILDLGVLSVTSYAPENGGDPCIPGGTSYLYKIDLTSAFKNGWFGSEGAATIGYQLRPGTASSMMPLHEPVDYGPSVTHTMDQAQLKTMLTQPKYQMNGNRGTNLDGTGPCTNIGLRVDGTFARIPTNCAGLQPIRSWRPIR